MNNNEVNDGFMNLNVIFIYKLFSSKNGEIYNANFQQIFFLILCKVGREENSNK